MKTGVSAVRDIFSSSVENPLPLCFPFAGRVWQNGTVGEYALGEGKFKMPIHGFLHERSPLPDFERREIQNFKFVATSETLKMYPFYFQFDVSWQVFENKIRGDFSVIFCTSVDSQRFPLMPVAFGLHPYFTIDASITNFIDSTAKSYRTVSSVGNASESELVFSQRRLSTQSSLSQSLILQDLETNEVFLKKPEQKIKITFGPQKDFRYVVLWQRAQGGFQCIEPWTGLPDAVHRPNGCEWLHPEEKKNWWFEAEILS